MMLFNTFTKKIHIPEDLKKVNEIFQAHGYKAYLVGGAVRDMLLGKEIHDWDLATNARPEEVMSIFHHVIPTGIAHGTVTIMIFNHQIETTTFRTEASYSDGRHPDKIKFAPTIEEDLSRRDFTINAIAADLADGSLIDPFKGQEDLKKKIIRTVGNPYDRFGEDGLRPVRAIRFASQLNFKIEEKTLEAINSSQVLEKVKSISVERFRDEFCKILGAEKPSISLKLLESSGILYHFIPEFIPCRNCIQKDNRGFHEFDVADHLIYACDGAPRNNLKVRLAAFYHDIGKPEAKTVETVDGETLIHFHGHEGISEKKCRQSMTSLKFSNSEIDSVAHLVKEHMYFFEDNWSNAAVRRFIIRIGIDNLDDIMALRFADVYGMHNCPVKEFSPTWNSNLELRKRIDAVKNEKSVFSLKNMAVNGKDLIALGIPKGPVIGKILSSLFETVTDSPEMNEKEKLLTLAENLYNEYKSRNFL